MFHDLGLDQDNLEWSADYRDREGVESWMGYNRMASALMTGQQDLALDVAEYCLGALPTDQTTLNIELNYGLCLVAKGDTAVAQEYFDNLFSSPTSWEQPYYVLLKMALPPQHEREEPKSVHADRWEEFLSAAPQWRQNKLLLYWVHQIKQQYKETGRHWAGVKVLGSSPVEDDKSALSFSKVILTVAAIFYVVFILLKIAKGL